MFCVAAIQKFKGGVTRLSSEPGATPTLLAGASILIYKNGVDVTATAGTHINPTSYGGFGIGAYDASGVYSAFVDGRMDDVRPFGRALSGPEVTALYGGGAL